MPTRQRTRSATASGLFKAAGSSVWNTYTAKTMSELCDDFVGNPKGDHNLTIEKVLVTGSTADGSGQGVAAGWVNCPCSRFNATAPTPSYLSLGSSDNDVNRCIAVTNPSRPDVLLPAFIGELRDLPRMIKYGAELGKFLTSPQFRREVTGSHRFKDDYMDAGRLVHYLKPTAKNAISASQQLGAANLAIQFGLLPLFGDLKRMVLFMDSVEKRRKESNRLFSGNGLRRRLDVNASSEDFQVNYRVESRYSTYGVVPLSTQRTARRWATVRWKPASPSQLPPSDETIRQLLMGMTLQSVASVAWELLPWSWLADYFGNVGQTLTALNNRIPVSAPRVNIMTTYSESLSHPGGIWSTSGGTPVLKVSSGSRKATRKLRATYVGVQLPSFGLPELGARQLSILSSIVSTRAYRN